MTARTLLATVACLALTGCAAGGGSRPSIARMLQQGPNIGKVVATEIAFARAAQEDGQWTAFRAFAASDATMFVPQAVDAQEWLKKQADPAQAVKWQPHEVWSSCDGSLAVTKGAWQRPDGSHGYFTTAWQRQQDGEYKWVMDQGEPLATPLVAPEFVRSEVADCDGEPQISVHHVNLEAVNRTVHSKDKTLQVEWNVHPSGRRHVSVTILRGGETTEVFKTIVEAPAS